MTTAGTGGSTSRPGGVARGPGADTERAPGRPGAPWWRGAVVHHVYPRSFADSDGDGVGDLPGITGRLGYLARLGVDAVWLSPIYASPMVDFGYDISDHRAVDPVFGTMADLDALVATAHGHGMRVLLDFVPHHTSDAHPWFADARTGRDSTHRDWYVWADPGPDGGPPNNWLSAFAAVGSAWTPDPTSGQYYLHSYTPHQPDLNWWNPQVRAAMHEVLRFWLDRGVDGFRIDVPHRLLKDRDLAPNPPQVAHLRRDEQLDGIRHTQIDHPQVHGILRGFRRVVDDHSPGRLLVGEVGIGDPVRMAAYHGTAAAPELDLAFCFPLWQQPWSAPAFRGVVERLLAALPGHVAPAVALSNHDITRAATRFDPDGTRPGRARAAAVLLLTLPGTVFLYYGEELGMRDVPVPPDRRHDPDGRDPVRTPLPWSAAGPGRGFTTGTPWLPVDPPPPDGPADVQEQDPGSMLHLHRRLIALRRSHPALAHGDHRFVHQPGDADRDLLVHRRTAPDGTGVLVAINFGGVARPLTLPRAGAGRVLLTTDPGGPDRGWDAGRDGVVLRPDEAVLVDLAPGPAPTR